MEHSSDKQALYKHEVLREWLIAEAADTDDERLRITLESIGDLHAAIACVVRSYLEDLTLVAALGIRLDEMQSRLARLEARADEKRVLVTSVMEQAEIKKLTEPDFTLTMRRTLPPLIVTDESAVPAAFWIVQAPILDTPGLTSALRCGQAIPGAKLGSGHPVISVRSN
ncbi:MAG: hypothetical protein JWL84_3485 [Rhodospirillales bacterium]|nr:hypothetical protein [Rhodospirillales bacterium]